MIKIIINAQKKKKDMIPVNLNGKKVHLITEVVEGIIGNIGREVMKVSDLDQLEVTLREDRGGYLNPRILTSGDFHPMTCAPI